MRHSEICHKRGIVMGWKMVVTLGWVGRREDGVTVGIAMGWEIMICYTVGIVMGWEEKIG